MLSPAISTNLKSKRWRNATICAATSCCGFQPRPLSPITANLIDRSSFGNVSVPAGTLDTSIASRRGCSRASEVWPIQVLPQAVAQRAEHSSKTCLVTVFAMA